MKNISFKFLILNFLVLSTVGCPNPNGPNFSVAGTWQNTIKNSDNSTVTTNLNVTDKSENFDATMTIVLKGSESETLKLPTKEIKFSGKINRPARKLVITDIQSDNGSSYTESSSFDVSDTGEFLTLNPGNIKFKKSENK